MKNLRMVEIELFSYCNRVCDWCPNKYVDRHTKIEYLDSIILYNLLLELQKNEYKGVFSFSRYNEPFADFYYMQACLFTIKQFFPNNKLVCNTNGDFLTKNKINNTLIDELTIMDYDCNGKQWCYDKLKEWEIENIKEYKNFWVGEKGHLKVLYYWDWPVVSCISNRGGILNEYSSPWIKRSNPCLEPQYFIGINYDGTVSPCCNIRSDCGNRKFILGSLKDNTLAELWNMVENKEFREAAAASKFPNCCTQCLNEGGRYTTKNGLLDF